MADSSQKFIARNRAPRVQIEYDVELYGAEKKVQLPFVMGVMSDLLGKNKENQPPIADRKFLEIDVDNFDSRMKSMAPRAGFTVPNTLTGEGNMAIDLTFESMKDFSPGAIAAKVDALRPLLEARNQLQTLMAYMDGKSGAEELIERILQDPALLASLAATTSVSDADQAAVLDTLRDVDLRTEEPDNSADVLAGLARQAPSDGQTRDATAKALASLSEAQPEAGPRADKTAAALASLADATPSVAEEEATEDAALASLREASVPETEDGSNIDDEVLNSLERAEPSTASNSGAIEKALDSLPDGLEHESKVSEGVADILTDLADQGSTEPEAEEEDPDLAALLGELDLAEDEETAADEAATVLDSLGELGAAEAPAVPEPLTDNILAEIAEASDEIATQEPAEDDLADILGGLEPVEEVASTEADEDLHDLLEGLTTKESDDTAAEQGLDDILAGLDVEEDPEVSDEVEPDDILGELAQESDELEAQATETETEVDLDNLLADLDFEEASETNTADDDLGSVLTGLASEGPQDLPPQPAEEPEGEDFDLDALLGDLDAESDGSAPEGAGGEIAEEVSELDALLSDLDTDSDASEDDDGLGELDDLLGDLDTVSAEPEGATGPSNETVLGSATEGEGEPTPDLAEPEFAYGTFTAARPSSEQLTRRRFRIALFGDFSGRSAKGLVEIGADLAARPPILLDPDTVEKVIEGFASELVLPIGKDGAGIAVKLNEFDDLHPDQLFENVDLFAELVGLRKQLQSGVTVDHASRTLADWAAKHGTPVRAPKRQSAGTAVPADRRLSAFQQLIGDQGDILRQASPIEELLARVVGPHIRALPDPDVASMQEAVDAALGDAMRLILHHPEFQSLEAQWRSLDLIARSVEVDDTLEVVLYDVSAEELAADLAAQDDLTESGLTKLLTEAPMDPELGRGGYSALIGLYTFEETPPHAELLGRIARVAAHVDAPFFTSLSPEFLKLDKKDRPFLVAQAWDTLQAMPEAGHLGLASPRFLLRRPYGAKSDPVDVLDFEEFTQSEGLRGMLWGNPVVLVTILLARSFSENGASMQLGSIMSLGGMPYHTVYDQFGDQVALPCTERNIDLDKIAMANERGVMAVSAVKGRDELRLTSFASLAGGEILGPWTGVPAPEPSPPDPREAKGPAPTEGERGSDDEVTDDLGLDDLDLDGLGDSDSSEVDDDLGDLDDLLASFSEDDDEADGSEDDDEMDAELAALLADL